MDELTEAQRAIVDQYRWDLARLMARAKGKLVGAGVPDYAVSADAVYEATEKVIEDGMYSTLSEFGE
jgi:hypothetical protein